MSNNYSTPSAETIQGVPEQDIVAVFGGRKRTLRKRTRRGGQRVFGGDLMMQEVYGGRKRTLRKRTRRGGRQVLQTVHGGRAGYLVIR